MTVVTIAAMKLLEILPVPGLHSVLGREAQCVGHGLRGEAGADVRLDLQDRLVPELRLEGISDIEDANRFLASFMARLNARFSIPAADARDDWLPAPKDLDWFLCAKYRRTVGNDNTVRFGDVTIDIPPDPRRPTFARSRVEVHELRDGTVRVVHEGRVIAEKAASPGHGRLRPRGRKGLSEAGYLPVVVLPSRSRKEAAGDTGSVRATG